MRPGQAATAAAMGPQPSRIDMSADLTRAVFRAAPVGYFLPLLVDVQTAPDDSVRGVARGVVREIAGRVR